MPNIQSTINQPFSRQEPFEISRGVAQYNVNIMNATVFQPPNFHTHPVGMQSVLRVERSFLLTSVDELLLRAWVSVSTLLSLSSSLSSFCVCVQYVKLMRTTVRGRLRDDDDNEEDFDIVEQRVDCLIIR